MNARTVALLDRQDEFWSRVTKGAPEQCWLWHGSTETEGYGRMKIGGRYYKAHRLAWFYTYGSFPSEGLALCHHCDTPLCCNPAHLFPGSFADNVHDMCSKGRNRYVVGEEHGMARLRAEDVRAIRQMYASGMANCAELGEQYGVSGGHVWQIISGRCWKHV